MSSRLVIIEISDEDAALLAALIGDDWRAYAGDLRELVEKLVRAAADGIRRPGSWERGWVQQATGWDEVGHAG